LEIFVDFGLLEVMLALGLVTAARKIYSRKVLGGLFLLASVLLPLALLFLVRTELTRWLAAACLGTALVNAARIYSEIFRGSKLAARAKLTRMTG